MHDKALIRRTVLLRRDALTPQERDQSSRAAAIRLAGLMAELRQPGPIALFHSTPYEIDTSSAIAMAAKRGETVLLPRVVRRHASLAFHAYRQGDPLIPSKFGILEPTPIAPQLRPHVVVVPLVAFDRRGTRLGYGAGHYDRSLAELRAAGPIVTIGFALAIQEEDELPAEPHDEPIEWIVTEESVRRCG